MGGWKFKSIVGNLGLVRERIIALVVVELCFVFNLLNTSDFLVLEENV